jgi:signal transduction histidine kinase
MICHLFPEPIYFFFSTDVPPLLYYTHIPSVIIALFVGLYVFLQGKKSLVNWLLLGISLSFSFWAIIDLITWTNIDSKVILFFWSLLGLCSGFIAILSVYFIYVFLEKKDIPAKIKFFFFLLLTPIFLLTPTFYLKGFNLTECDAFKFESLSFYIYRTLLGILAMVWILFLLIRRYHLSKSDFRRQVVLIGIGIEFFLFIFFIITFIASYFTKIGILEDSRFEMYGLFGMTFFIGFVAFLIVHYKAFNIKLIGSQALVWALIVLVGSEFFFVENLINQILVGITLVISSVSGLLIVRSVKREITLREHLEIANRNQESLIHFVSHQLKGFFTKSKMIFSGIVENDFGVASKELKEAAKEGLLSDDNAVSMIQDILGASNLKKGTTTYNMKEVDFAQVVKKICESFTKEVADRGLELKCNIPDTPFKILADSTQIDQVVKNLIDNSLKYTPKGSVEVSLSSEKKDGKDKVLLIIKDTGIGLSESDKKKLFTEGGKGDESLKVNVNSTGYGLYIVKKIVENHGGKIWAESDGRGMGSRFYVELGLIK